MSSDLNKGELTQPLQALGAMPEVEILLIGAAAGILTGELEAGRTTTDCDVIHYLPSTMQKKVEDVARDLAIRNNWAADWFNSRAMELDVLPAGWRHRRCLVQRCQSLSIYARGRLNLLATKFFASRPQDRDDIRSMRPQREELRFVRRYLQQMRLPRRQAHLDDLERAVAFLSALEREVTSHG